MPAVRTLMRAAGIAVRDIAASLAIIKVRRPRQHKRALAIK
jgi:hypothetical protein